MAQKRESWRAINEAFVLAREAAAIHSAVAWPGESTVAYWNRVGRELQVADALADSIGGPEGEA